MGPTKWSWRGWIVLLLLPVTLAAGCTTMKTTLLHSDKWMPGPTGPSPLAAAENDKTLSDWRKPKATPEMLVDIGNLCLMTKQFDRAEQLFRRALEKDKRYAPAYASLGRLYLALDKPQEALLVLEQGAHKAPKSAKILNEMAVARMKLGDQQRALADMEAAVKEDPQEPLYLTNLAGMLALAGQHQRSYELYAKVLPTAEAHYQVAGVFLSQGQKQAGLRELELAVAADPGHQKSVEMLASLTGKRTK